MSKLIKTIESIEGLYKAKGCSLEQITSAENILNIQFSTEYKEYLRAFGAISFNAVELTGLNVDSYANVVDQTLQEQNNSNTFPKGCIVIENTGCDGLLILQNNTGEIFEWHSFGNCVKIHNSLLDYILSK